MPTLISLALMLVFARWCSAADTCLWLNEATAAGILDGSVSLRVVHTPNDMPAPSTAYAKSGAGPMSANPSAPAYVNTDNNDEECLFTRTGAASARQIRIEVTSSRQPHAQFNSRLAVCGSPAVPLQAIGNEAAVCSGSVKPAVSKTAAEQVIGRVRERVFLIGVSGERRPSDQTALRESALSVARVVAGNLF